MNTDMATSLRAIPSVSRFAMAMVKPPDDNPLILDKISKEIQRDQFIPGTGLKMFDDIRQNLGFGGCG